jgi:type I restriction enzyme, S subunit
MKPYPKYKDSGIEWIGEVPEWWNINRLKHFVSVMPSNIDKKSKETEKKIYLCNYIDVYKNEFITDEISFMEATASDDQIEKFRLTKYDVIITKDSEEPSDIAIPALVLQNLKEVVCGYHLAILRVSSNKLFGGFLFWFFNSKLIRNYFTTEAKGITRYGIGSYSIENVSIIVPSITEQTTIAAFLDRKTAEIDSIISKKERLIELYEEEKAAIINHAVTKGLNPAAKMKDSGIEWLGEIPEHWETAELRRYINFITSGSRGWAEHYSDEGKIFVRIGNLTRNSIGLDLSDIQRVQPPDGAEGERTKIEKGDILFSITAYIGSVAVATDEIVGSYINQHIALVRPCFKKIYPQFVAYLACSDFGQIQLIEQGYGGTKVQLSLDDVKSLRIPIAPLKEQLAIVQHIETKCSRIDAIISKFKRQIELLKEYRTALISEAVTGKIDLRNQI